MNKYIMEQNGRSMIEMLGVLAIVGVLSVAGIAGYSKAMAKYKTNKLIDQVSNIVANVRTTFAGQGDYKGLNAETAYKLGIYPEEIAKGCDGRDDYMYCPRPVIGSAVNVYFVISDPSSFDLYVADITKDACSTLLTTDWGSAAGFSGILKLTPGDWIGDGYAGEAGSQADIYDREDLKDNLLSNISTVCDCGNEDYCIVGLRFR